MEIQLLPGYDKISEIRELLTEYTAMLIEGEPAFSGYLQMQNYDDELRDPYQKYGPPLGRLYLLQIDGQSAGCVALRPLDSRRCEMKRLYVRPAFRGHALGRRMVEQIITDARAIGYQRVMLDTLPFLRSALKLYREMGFFETEDYDHSPIPDTIYMEYDL